MPGNCARIFASRNFVNVVLSSGPTHGQRHSQRRNSGFSIRLPLNWRVQYAVWSSIQFFENESMNAAGTTQEQTADRIDSTTLLCPSKLVEVFFDGACPLCVREIGMIRRRDRHQRIQFTDIAAPAFSAEQLGVTQDALMARIHGRLPDGTWIEGVEVFRRLYSAVGFGPLVAVTRLPGISHLLDAGYRVFARNRLKFTGRCTAESCSLPENPV